MSDSASSFMTASSDLPSQWWDTEEHKTKAVITSVQGAIIFLVTGAIVASILFSALRRKGNYGMYEDGSTENGQPNLQDW
ncbi:hypothetical protein FB451DRAFT_1401250 [Mycena latifolia]|nr:hypothetical protein FB451DRAFT_1401250 [Mycena latifolia]